MRITVQADLLALDGIVSWPAVGATISSSNNNATIAAANVPGVAMTLTASFVALVQTFNRSIGIVKRADGAPNSSNYAMQSASTTVSTWAARFIFRVAAIGATVKAGNWSTPVVTSQMKVPDQLAQTVRRRR